MDIHQIIADEIIFEIEGLAPYSFSSTQKALSFIELPKKRKKVANIGSGTGYTTLMLYDFLKTNIVSVDHRKFYVNKFQEELSNQKLDKYIDVVYSPLDTLPFEENELDLIWAESLTKDISFNDSLSNWQKYLASSGYIGICAYCWNTDDRPREVVEFFSENKIDNESLNSRIGQMFSTGFLPIAHFTLPEECWWNYFCPLDINKDSLLRKYYFNCDVVEVIDKLDQEISLFEKYGELYSYVFFIGKKL